MRELLSLTAGVLANFFLRVLFGVFWLDFLVLAFLLSLSLFFWSPLLEELLSSFF